MRSALLLLSALRAWSAPLGAMEEYNRIIRLEQDVRALEREVSKPNGHPRPTSVVHYFESITLDTYLSRPVVPVVVIHHGGVVSRSRIDWTPMVVPGVRESI